MCIPRRYFITFFVFVGFIFHYYLRINLSVAIVDMTADKITIHENKTFPQLAEFDWNSRETGFMLSAFFYGVLFAPIGGYLAPKFGGATIFGIGIAATGILTILSPLLVRLNYYVFLIIRILEGLAEGWASTGEIELWSRWAPVQERARILTYSLAGTYVGTIISFQLSGFCIQLYGWPSVFYLPGAATLIWYLLFAIFVSNDPFTDRFISESERLYLKESLHRPYHEKIIYPWKKIFKSSAVWAALMFYFLAYSEQTITTVYLPMYLKDVSNGNIEMIGYFSSVPHVVALIAQTPIGYLADFLRNSKVLKLTQIYKVYICCGSVMMSILLSIIMYQTDLILITILMSIFKFFSCFCQFSARGIFLDMAPQYSSFLSGIGYIVASLGAIWTTTYVGYIVKNHSRYEWNICFLTIAVLHTLAGIYFYIYSSAERQPWAKSPPYHVQQIIEENVDNEIDGIIIKNKTSDVLL